MDYNIYLLATDPNNPCRDVIHSRDTRLKIRVFCLNEESFNPDSNEIQLYGYAQKKLYAFETINIAADDALEVVSEGRPAYGDVILEILLIYAKKPLAITRYTANNLNYK